MRVIRVTERGYICLYDIIDLEYTFGGVSGGNWQSRHSTLELPASNFSKPNSQWLDTHLTCRGNPGVPYCCTLTPNRYP